VPVSEVLIGVGKRSIAHPGAQPICARRKEPQHNLDYVGLAATRRPLNRDRYRPLEKPRGQRQERHLRVLVLADFQLKP
jgi:hypothetical protein